MLAQLQQDRNLSCAEKGASYTRYQVSLRKQPLQLPKIPSPCNTINDKSTTCTFVKLTRSFLDPIVVAQLTYGAAGPAPAIQMALWNSKSYKQMVPGLGILGEARRQTRPETVAPRTSAFRGP